VREGKVMGGGGACIRSTGKRCGNLKGVAMRRKGEATRSLVTSAASTCQEASDMLTLH
jgi:hypothetical protein